MLSDDTHIIYYQKRQSQSDMMPSVPCESTQKIHPNDTHIIYYQNRQWDMMIIPIRKYSKNAFR